MNAVGNRTIAIYKGNHAKILRVHTNAIVTMDINDRRLEFVKV